MIYKKIFTILIIVIILLLSILGVYKLINRFSNLSVVYLDNQSLVVNRNEINPTDITAFDIQIKINGDAKLKSATLGETYKDYVKLKWDLEEGRFAAFINPQLKDVVNSNKSNEIVKLEFDTSNGGQTTSIMIDPNSLLYVKGQGGIYIK